MVDPLFDRMCDAVFAASLIFSLAAMFINALVFEPRARHRRYEQQRLRYSKRRMEAIRRGEF